MSLIAVAFSVSAFVYLCSQEEVQIHSWHANNAHFAMPHIWSSEWFIWGKPSANCYPSRVNLGNVALWNTLPSLSTAPTVGLAVLNATAPLCHIESLNHRISWAVRDPRDYWVQLQAPQKTEIIALTLFELQHLRPCPLPWPTCSMPTALWCRLFPNPQPPLPWHNSMLFPQVLLLDNRERSPLGLLHPLWLPIPLQLVQINKSLEYCE